MITPTVGRVLHYYPPAHPPGAQPWVALIAHVHGPRMVNLAIWDSNGMPITAPPTSIPLLQDADQPPAGGVGYCRWMPYQEAKAAAGNAPSESAEPRPVSIGFPLGERPAS